MFICSTYPKGCKRACLQEPTGCPLRLRTEIAQPAGASYCLPYRPFFPQGRVGNNLAGAQESAEPASCRIRIARTAAAQRPAGVVTWRPNP